MGLNRYGAGGGVGSGAQPQKPEVAILLRAMLITKTVVAGFRGEKNEGMSIVCKEIWGLEKERLLL